MVPSLAAHGVQAYFAGHVHNLQHSVGADGVNYFVSGAGAFSSLDHAAAPTLDAGAHAAAGVHRHAGDAAHHDFLPDDVRVGTSHKPRPVACAPGSACAPSTNAFIANGPGFLALSVDNAASPPTTTASFLHANGTVLYTTTFTAGA